MHPRILAFVSGQILAAVVLLHLPGWPELSPWLLAILPALCILGWKKSPAHTLHTLAAFGTGLSITLFLLGIQVPEKLHGRLPANCHGQTRTLHLTLTRSYLSDHGPRFEALLQTPSDCLAQGSVIRLDFAPSDLPQTPNPDTNKPLPFSVGDTLVAEVQLKSPRGKLQFHGFDREQHYFMQDWKAHGQIRHVQNHTPKRPNMVQLPAWLQQQWGQMLTNTLQGHPQLPLVAALSIGDQGLVLPEERDLYANTGIAHLVAVSGVHITLLFHALGVLLGFAFKSKARGQWLALALAVLYALVTGFQPPAARTCLMLCGFVLAARSGRTLGGLAALALAASVTLLANPMQVLDVGWQLSFGALLALTLPAAGLVVYRHSRFAGLKAAMQGQYHVTLGLLPLSALLFHSQSLVSPVANALSIPLMSFVSTPLALVGSVLRSHTLLLLAADSLQWQEGFLHALSQSGQATAPLPAPSIGAFVLSSLGALLLLLPRNLAPRFLGWPLLVLPLMWPLLPPAALEQGEFEVLFPDIGQGGATLVLTPHHTLVFDTGPAYPPFLDSGRSVMLPSLKAQGRLSIDALWLSHADSDHSGGAGYLLGSVPVQEFVSALPANHSLNTQAEQLHIPASACQHKKPWVWDGVSFTPLGLPPEHPAYQKKSNNHACLLRVESPYGSLLLTGDIEADYEEALLLATPPGSLQAQVLVVPHHGSKTSSTPGFLQAVQPRLAIVQSGWKNHYGHPHQQVMQRYVLRGIPVLNSAQSGAIALSFRDSAPDWQQKSAQPQAETARNARKRLWRMAE
ncbi:MAG: DNA internalization-related competence protein ComEC/Rec2 [Limnobacter sp.]|nr:DNA internalization-related competence protein ComEC/Rec2 [Limnobacter sp.]